MIPGKGDTKGGMQAAIIVGLLGLLLLAMYETNHNGSIENRLREWASSVKGKDITAGQDSYKTKLN
jgi:hypothetical protein